MKVAKLSRHTEKALASLCLTVKSVFNATYIPKRCNEQHILTMMLASYTHDGASGATALASSKHDGATCTVQQCLSTVGIIHFRVRNRFAGSSKLIRIARHIAFQI